MGQISLPEGAKLFCGLLVSPSFNIEILYKILEDHLGPIDSRSEIIPFNFTDYYQPEMGPGLRRQYVSFEKPVFMNTLADIKILTNSIEEKFTGKKKRLVNIDPGYLTLYQVVLASTKKFYHRIYLREGIYAEVTLYYRKGWTALEWTYQDYQSETGISYFNRLRELYKRLKNSSSL